MLFCLQTDNDQLRLRAVLAGMRSDQVSVVFRHNKHQFPYYPWINPDISPGLPETLCVCTGLSENPHIRGAEVSGVPPGLLSEVQCLLKNSCHSITVNGESLHQVEPSNNQNSDEEYVCVCTYRCESHASHMYAAAHTQCFQWLYTNFSTSSSVCRVCIHAMGPCSFTGFIKFASVCVCITLYCMHCIQQHFHLVCTV